jgi:hypothetical protein
MAFWSSKESQPKRQHRFLMSLGNYANQNQLPSWVVSNVTRPAVEVSTVEHQYLNHTFKFPGRAKWQDISITLKDPLSPDASKQLYDILERAGYTPPSAARGPEDDAFNTTFTKKSFSDTLGPIFIKALNSEGDEVERWTLFNPIIVSANWGQFDYSSEELVELQLTIAYDYATIE